MNVVLVTTNLAGGAGGAARRLHDGLRGVGVSSTVVTRDPGDHGTPAVVAVQSKLGSWYGPARRSADRLPKLRYRHRERTRSFDPQWLPDRLPSTIARLRPDLVNLHWVCNAFVGVGSLSRLQVPIVWTLHDMWPFTGGCFYSEDCDRYMHACGGCPVLGSSRERDLSRRVWRQKAKAWKGLDLTIVAPSSWMATCARSSSLFGGRRVEVIPYGLDLDRFKPMDRGYARAALNLPLDAKLVLFGAWGDPRRKGLDLLAEAMKRLDADGGARDAQLVVFGALEVPVSGLKSHHIGRVEGDRTLAMLYAAADVTVIPSTWDNLPFTALESIACGTPLVAFDAATGLPDVIDHGQNGYLARAFDPGDLARGIEWVLEDRHRHDALAAGARAKAEREFSLEGQIKRYLSLFTDVVAEMSSRQRRLATGT